MKQRHRAEIERLLDVQSDLELALIRSKTLFTECPVALVTFDYKGVIADLNRAAKSLIGSGPHVFLRPKPFLVFVHPPDIRLFCEHLINCRRDGGGQMELRLRRGDGEPRPVELVSRTAYSPLAAAPVFVTVLYDVETITERDRALAHSERRYREIVETAGEGICIIDEHNDVVFANRRLAAMVGRPSESLVGAAGDELLVQEDRAAAQDAFDNRRASNQDVRLRRADGSSVWASVSTSLLRDEHGRFMGMLRMFSDASARHQLAESRDTMMRELVAAQERERERIARELHDEMGQHIVALGLGVAKLAQLAADVPLAQPVLSRLREIADLLGRDVHTLAFQLRPAALDHLGLAVALANYGEHMSAHAGIEVDVHCDDLTGLPLSGTTQTGLYRIAQEAVTNAVKHAHATRVSLILERRRDALVLIVEDNGKGLQPTQGVRQNGGFGLTGMKERASLLGGELSIEPTPGHGTTVFVRIPLGDHELSTSTPAR